MRSRLTGFSIILAALASAPPVAQPVVVSSGASPAVLGTAGVPDDAVALSLSPDGRSMAYALASRGKKEASDLVLATVGLDSTRSVSVRGVIRDLLFLEDGRVLVLHHTPAKRWEGDTFLTSWVPGAPKTERLMRVPPSSTDLSHWPGGDAVLLSCRNEIRTLLGLDLTTGPVFMFPGNNLAVSSLGRGSYVWVGQDTGLFLIDLSQPSGRDAMRVLAQQPVPAPVAALVEYPGGTQALVRLSDGRLFRASLDPPGFEAQGSADHIVGPTGAGEGPSLTFARAPVEPEALPEPTPAEPLVEEAEPAVVAQPEPIGKPDAPRARLTHQLSGTIGGSSDLVRYVVLLGPDNILHEAARVKPEDNGGWAADGLAPGRYVVQLDGGGTRVLVTKPRLVWVEVGDDAIEAPAIEVLRAF